MTTGAKQVSVDHVTAIVADAEAAATALTRLTGASPVAVSLPGMDIRTFRFGEVELHVNAPTSTGPVQDFLQSHGAGFHHVALRVDDLDAFVASSREQGFRPLGAPVETAPGLRELFLDPRTTGGVMVQLVERRPELSSAHGEQAARQLDGDAVRALTEQRPPVEPGP